MAHGGGLPPGSPEAAVIFYMVAEHGVWAHSLPLLELPPALGEDVLWLLSKEVPHRLDVLQRIAQTLQRMEQAQPS